MFDGHKYECVILWSSFGAAQGWLETRKRNRGNDLD